MTATQQRYLLDTNILSNIVRDTRGEASLRCQRLGEARVCTSIVVACELRFGARKRGSNALTQRVDEILNSLNVLPFDKPSDRTYAEVRLQLQRAGTPISHADLMIAAQALSAECTLVTDNMREFQRVPKLRVENWLR